MPSNLIRYHAAGHDHFITFSCYKRQPFLNDDHSRTVFEDVIERLRVTHGFFLHRYVLMPEHVHLLISEPVRHPLSTTLGVLKNATSSLLKGNRKQFWQVRYYDFNVFTRPKHVEKLRYMHRNPVVRGLVEEAEHWPWSSYRHYLTGEHGEHGRIEIESHWTWNRRHPTPPTA